jgi:hypothetical protein
MMKMPRKAVSSRSRTAAFTLLELLVGTGIAGIVFAILALCTFFTARSFIAMGNYTDLDKASRNALDIMSRDIRQTKAVLSVQTNQIQFRDFDGGLLTYTWDKAAGTLVRNKDGWMATLLKDCDYLSFAVSQRNPSNDFSFYPATSNAPAKLIDVSWNCSRKILQQKVNTESVQTAKIVIRN